MDEGIENKTTVIHLLNDVVYQLINDTESGRISSLIISDESEVTAVIETLKPLENGKMEMPIVALQTMDEAATEIEVMNSDETSNDFIIQQVRDLVDELIDIVDVECNSAICDMSSVDNFVLQQDYIPEHLLNDSDEYNDSSMESSDSSLFSSDESSSSGSLIGDDYSENESDGCNRRGQQNYTGRKTYSKKTKGEFGLDDLPPIQNLQISVDRSEVQLVGRVLSIVDCLVVVQSQLGKLALNLDTVLFFESGECLGQIFDVFGPVIRPLYSVRFNNTDDIKAKNVIIGSSIYYAPEKSEFTTFVFPDQLRRMRGSDASWENNNEPPERYLDYSDDEQEKLAKMRLRNRERRDDDVPKNNDTEQNAVIKHEIRPQAKRGRGRQRGHRANISEGREVASLSLTSTVRPSTFQHSQFSRPPYNHYGYQAQYCPRSTPNVMNRNPFYNPAPSYRARIGPYNPPPMFNPNIPPPPPPPPPFSPRPFMNPERSSFVQHEPISSLFTNQSRQTVESNISSNNSATTSSASSSNILPNPFRLTNSEKDETTRIPQFPPVGFVPRL